MRPHVEKRKIGGNLMNKAGKLLLACLICISVIWGIVWLIQQLL